MMSWTLLLLLACPLIMLFCMKGMFGGTKNKDTEEPSSSQLQASSQEEKESVPLKMADVMEENHQLREEVKSLKGSESKHANTGRLENNQDKQKA
jgi:hypothetical protein